MSVQAPTLRSDQIRLALDEAIARGDQRFFSLLSRHGNLPGPQPNTDLAAAVGDLLASRREAQALVRQMLVLDEREAPGQSPQIFLIMVAAQALAARIIAKIDVDGSWQELQVLAGDPRKLVRDGVVRALERVAVQQGGGAALARLAAWTDGFLQAAVALEALALRPVLDRMQPSDVGELLARLDETATLAEEARRADERTQGRRRLLEALADALPPIAARFPDALAWLAGRATTQQPELRQAIELCLVGLKRHSLTDDALDPIRKALDGSVPPLRDPTHYKGPTRGRGRKAQRREQRRLISPAGPRPPRSAGAAPRWRSARRRPRCRGRAAGRR